MKDKKYLLIPGPTQVPPPVVEAMSRPIIGHRSAEFQAIVERVTGKLKKVFQTKNDVFILGSSGTGALEAAVANLVNPGDKVLALSCGKFGERFRDLAKIYGGEVDFVDFGWGYDIDLKVVKKKLEENPDIKVVLATQNETSTGVQNDIEGLGKLVAQYEAVLAVDAVSGLAAIDLKTDEWHIDIVASGSQKALMLPPGLAFLSVSDKAWRKIEENTSPKYYFDLLKARKSIAKWNTAYTTPVSMVYGLDAALDMILEEGLDNVFERHKLLAKATRAAIQGLGLELLAPDDCASMAVTAVQSPMVVDADTLRKVLLRDYGVTFAGGQDAMKGKIFRIAHMGFADKMDVIIAISALEMALGKCGYKAELGAGVREAQMIFVGGEHA
ncbi:alanine--glyoxylate aminotransferase family protein [Desulfotomaculum defluvii]